MEIHKVLGEIGTQFWPCSSQTRPGKWQKQWLNVSCSLKYAEKLNRAKKSFRTHKPVTNPGRAKEGLISLFSPSLPWLCDLHHHRKKMCSGTSCTQDTGTTFEENFPVKAFRMFPPHIHLVWDTKCLYHREIFPQGGKPQHWFSLLDWCFCIFQVQWNCSSPSKMEEDERKDNKLIYFKIKIKINTSQAVPNGRGSDVIC